MTGPATQDLMGPASDVHSTCDEEARPVSGVSLLRRGTGAQSQVGGDDFKLVFGNDDCLALNISPEFKSVASPDLGHKQVTAAHYSTALRGV